MRTLFTLMIAGIGVMLLLQADVNVSHAQQLEWVQIDTDTSPSARRSLAMAYDPENKLIILFGGYGNSSHLNDTWIYDPQTDIWNEVSTLWSPSPRAATTLVFEPGTKQLILFGGFALGHSVVYNDTWAYNALNSTWTDLKAANPPAERASYGMTFDSKSHAIVLFGGFTEQEYFNDVWVYDPIQNSWFEQDISGDEPSPRGAMGFAYDKVNDVFIMFGGFSNSGFFDDTWILDLNNSTWTKMEPDISPPPARTRLIYHEAIGKAVFFGGDIIRAENIEPVVEPYDKVWAYDYSSNEWEELAGASSLGGSPAKRSLNGIAYDSDSRSILIFGGTDALIDAQNFAGHEFQDTWALVLKEDNSNATPGQPESRLQSLSPMVPVLGAITAVGIAIAFFLRARFRPNSSHRDDALARSHNWMRLSRS